MICPKCGSKMKVVDTRTYNNVCLRAYKCLKCNNRFYTNECETSVNAYSRFVYNLRRLREELKNESGE